MFVFEQLIWQKKLTFYRFYRFRFCFVLWEGFYKTNATTVTIFIQERTDDCHAAIFGCFMWFRLKQALWIDDSKIHTVKKMSFVLFFVMGFKKTKRKGVFFKKATELTRGKTEAICSVFKAAKTIAGRRGEANTIKRVGEKTSMGVNWGVCDTD